MAGSRHVYHFPADTRNGKSNLCVCARACAYALVCVCVYVAVWQRGNRFSFSCSERRLPLTFVKMI